MLCPRNAKKYEKKDAKEAAAAPKAKAKADPGAARKRGVEADADAEVSQKPKGPRKGKKPRK